MEEKKEVIPYKPIKAIPTEIEDTLFFMWFSGMSYSDIAKQYSNTVHIFSASHVGELSKRRSWQKRKQAIIDNLSSDFDDILKHSRAKKMTAIAMAIDTVSEMIIKDVTDFRTDPKMFWDQVYTKQRPKPFWMAKSVDDLVNLFKLQQYLEQGKEEEMSATISLNAEQRTKLLGTLSELRKTADIKPELLKPEEIVEAEVTIEGLPDEPDKE
jgi:hypothetical protein